MHKLPKSSDHPRVANPKASSSLLPSVAKQNGSCFKDETTCSLLNEAIASLTIEAAFVLNITNEIKNFVPLIIVNHILFIWYYYTVSEYL